MNFLDLLYENEGINISPFSLFSIGKRSLFNKVDSLRPKKEEIDQAIEKKTYPIKSFLGTTKEKIKAKKEQIMADLKGESGIGKEGTLYDLTDEQLDVMAYIFKKYGYKLYKEIRDFRQNVLAPFEVIKRDLKKNSRVTAKEVYGLTKEEFLQAYESGRKKIENRGMKYVDNSRNITGKIEKYDDVIKDIKKIKQDFIESGKYDSMIVNKLLNKLGGGPKEFSQKMDDSRTRSYSLKKMTKAFDDLKQVTDAFTRMAQGGFEKDIRREEDEINAKKVPEERKLELIKQLEEKYRKKELEVIDKLIDKNSVFKDRAFLASLPAFVKNQNINKAFKDYAENRNAENVYYGAYLKIIENWLDKEQSFKMDKVDELKSLDDDLEFNENEKKIFKLKLGAPKYSSNINDYKQKIKIEDYPDEAYIPIKRSDSLNKAIEAVEKEIKKFESKLGKTISSEDMALLKEYRLINNLIKIKELDNPDALFKTPKEIERVFKTIEKHEDEMEYNVETKEKDTHYIKAIEKELESAKKFKKIKDEVKFRAQKQKIRNLIKEFRRVDVKANSKLARFSDDFDELNFSVLTNRGDD